MCPVTPRDPRKVSQQDLDALVDQMPEIPTLDEMAEVPRHIRIRFARKRLIRRGYAGKRVTQEDVATLLDVEARSVKRWESPRGNAPEADHAAKLTELANEGLLTKDPDADPYPVWLFMSPPPFEETIAEEINRKLSLLLQHHGIEMPPGADGVESVFRTAEQVEREQADRVGRRSRGGVQ